MVHCLQSEKAVDVWMWVKRKTTSYLKVRPEVLEGGEVRQSKALEPQ